MTNKWLKNGTLPEKGEIVRSVNHQGQGPVLAAWVSTKGEPVVCWNNGTSDYNGTPLKFIREGKTEKQILVELAMSQIDYKSGSAELAIENLVDLGWRPKHG